MRKKKRKPREPDLIIDGVGHAITGVKHVYNGPDVVWPFLWANGVLSFMPNYQYNARGALVSASVPLLKDLEALELEISKWFEPGAVVSGRFDNRLRWDFKIEGFRSVKEG